MPKNCFAAYAAALVCLGAAPAIAADPEVTADQAVGALEQTFGIHPGERRNHAKGTCALGTFVGAKDAARYSRSALFSGAAVPVVARFSLAGGNPKAPDTAKSARGMALEFALPDGGRQHMAMINTPVFGAASPQSFVDLITAMRPDPATGKPDPEKIKAFKASHPDNRMQAHFLESNNPPASYASSAYLGLHAFKFIGTEDKTTLVRWQFVPEDGEKRLSDDELKAAGADFLERTLIDRTRQGPVRWDMVATIGQPGDAEDDPTVAWPEARPKVTVGTLTITAAMPQKGAACETINYDPLVMADGIAATDDPVLLFRSPAYAVSFARRMGGM